MEGKEGTSTRIRDWKGLLADKSAKTKALVFGALFIVSSAMTFMQLGFIGIGPHGEYVGYILGLMAPIAVSALLLGKGLGCLQGVVSGAVLILHSRFQPLDVFEYAFVTPLSSIMLFGFMGFFVGLLYAIALRNKPHTCRRAIYLAIVAGVASTALSMLFLLCVFVSVWMNLVTQVSEGTGAVYYSRELILSLSSLGDFNLQALGDFALIFVLSLASSLVEQWYRRTQECARVRTTFCVWLLIAVVLVFLITGSFGFVVVTMQIESAQGKAMASEAEYLCKQLTVNWSDYEGVVKDAGLGKVDESTKDELITGMRSVSTNRLLDGYNAETDGVVTVFKKGDSGQYEVMLTDSPAFPQGASVADIFGESEVDIFTRFVSSGAMRRMLYTDEPLENLMMNNDLTKVQTQLGYVLVAKADDMYVMILRPSSRVFAERSTTVCLTTLSAFALLLVVYALAAILLRRTVVDPIDKTNESLKKITDGDLDEVVEVRGNVEFAELSNGINETVDALKGWIAEAETRMEHDLATAKAIQESALPRTFPPYPDIEQFDIYASMNAAKEVGGDFFDFFLIDDHTLGFMIADVSGKGVPGALFMMAAKTELENHMASGMDLAQAVTGANQALCANNDAGMFVTVWAATFDYQTGELTYVNAGHNPPLLRHGHGGSWEWMKKRCGLFLGTYSTAKYRTAKMTLEYGDELLLYTDGVNEAFNVNEEEYGNDRLEAFVAEHADLHPQEMVVELRNDVAKWAQGAEQSDDITILALEYGVAPEVTGSLTLEATIANLDKACRLVRDELRMRMCPPDVRNKVEVALEELFVNVCQYAYSQQEAPGMVTVSYVYRENPSAIVVELRDEGVPFDPVSRQDPTRPATVDEMPIGGLGILMVRKSMDDFSYVRHGNENVVAFKKSW